MKLVVATLLLTVAVAFATGGTPLKPWQINTLTTIDFVPSKDQLNWAFGGSTTDPQPALQKLVELATDADPITSPVDPGIRLRAIHALAKYCAASPCVSTDTAHEAVLTVLQQTSNQTSGKDVLFLRAAIETLGLMKVSTDVTPLLDQLNHPSRDIRAATARALRDLCNAQAILPLRARYSSETTDQVKLAISEALRILGQCQPN